ncbi:MAG: DUF1611 domain-containing protein, partial [Pirellulales bacterium]|nr:DUF1611 domain-containing protein [Pirellulales bacterium]
MPQKIVILTEGHTHPLTAKTACSVIRYRTPEVVAVLDSTQAGRDCEELLHVGRGIPIVASLQQVESADTLLLGIATQGGQIPQAWRRIILEALDRQLDIVSGLHDFLCDDEEIAAAAARLGRQLTDVRKNQYRSVSNRLNLRADCLRVHTVGNDCNVGKMVTSIEIARDLQARGHDAKFVATGQTGIMIEGDGCPIDCVVSDFVNGAAEQLVLDHQHHEILLVEGQGSIVHPRYSAVSLGLLHGAVPQALILCFEAGRETFRTMDHVVIPKLSEIKRLCEAMANAAHPCQVIGISMNTRKLSAEQAETQRQRLRDEFGVPVCDVFRHGPG